MKKFWRFVAIRENREILGWIATGVATLTGAIWTAFVYFEGGQETPRRHIDLTAIVNGCIEGPIHPDASTITQRIRKALADEMMVIAWKGGVASENVQHGTPVFAISDIISDGDAVMLKYKWQNGILSLKPVLPRYGSVRVGVHLVGGWLQDQGFGCLELNYDSSNRTAEGWWAAADRLDEKSSIFLAPRSLAIGVGGDTDTVKIRPLYFELGTAKLLPESLERLREYAKIINTLSAKTVLIEGHASEVRPAINFPLSSNRAKVVERALADLGVDPGEITIRAYGGENPVEGRTPDSAYNDRVEIRIEDRVE